MRARRTLAVPAALCTTLTALGCGSAPAAVPRAPGAPALTKAQAAQVLNRQEAAANKAATALDGTALAATERDPQLAMDAAAVKLHRATKRRPAPLDYAAPSFYIPRLTGFPRWFAADATAGKARRALLFVQETPAAPWRLAAAPYPMGTPLRGIALDRDGYAVPARADGTVAARHAALLTGGPAARGAAGLAVGPQTTQSYDALRTAQDKLKRGGITLTSRFTPYRGPAFALRTVDGGALVWYALRQNETYKAGRPGRVAVTGDLVGLVPARAAGTELGTTVLVQYLAKVPRRGPVIVTGMYRKAIGATAS